MDTRDRPVLNDIIDLTMMRKEMFQFQWLPDHFKYSTDQFITIVEKIDEDDPTTFKKLSRFVQSFSPVQKVDHTGRTMFDAYMEPTLEPHYISVKELVECESVDEAMDLLGIHFVFVAFVKVYARLSILLTSLLFVCSFCRING